MLSNESRHEITKTEVSVVVPVLNEAENLAELTRQTCDAFRSTNRSFEILYVDDGSTDGSQQIIHSLASQHESVRAVILSRNYGQTAALKAGIDHASGKYVVTIDGDLQNCPASIAPMLDKLDDGFDVVFGWRRHRHDHWSRKLASRWANRIICWFTRTRVNDLGCTLKAMKHSVARELELVGDMHRFIPVLVDQLGCRSCEIETGHRPRVHGTSKYGFSRIKRVLLDLIVLVALRNQSHPIQFYGKASFACLALSMLLGLTAFLTSPEATATDSGTSLFSVALLVAGGVAAVIGFQLLLFGLAAELKIRDPQSSASHRSYRVRSVIGMNLTADSGRTSEGSAPQIIGPTVQLSIPLPSADQPKAA